MINKKQNEALLYFTDNKYMYLAKLFKYVYFFEYEYILKNNKSFFNTDFVVDQIAPIPNTLWNEIINGKFIERYKTDWELLIPKGKGINVRNIKDFKIIALRPADLSSFKENEIDVLKLIKQTYYNYLPSKMFEKSLFKEKPYAALLENNGEYNKTVLNLEKLFLKKEK